MSAEFIKSAVGPDTYPAPSLPEVALLGRSNVGKSSLVNFLTGRKKLAQVSTTPGKTRLINFFNIDGAFVLVDLPGYGYSKRPATEKQDWKIMIEAYLSQRQTLKGLILVMDVRRSFEVEERQLLEWLEPRQLPFILVLNKTDKLNQKELQKRKREFENLEGPTQIIYTSMTKGHGLKELNHSIFENLLGT